jgi:hypothetical protein
MRDTEMLMDKAEIDLSTIKCYCSQNIKYSIIYKKRGVKK